MKIGVIGCGRWGTFLANHYSTYGYEVSLYGRVGSKRFEELIQHKSNDYISEISNKLNLTSDINEIFDNDVIFISITSSNLNEFVENLPINLQGISDKFIIVAMKGFVFDNDSNFYKTAVEYLGDFFFNSKVLLLSGPGHVENLIKDIPTKLELSYHEYFNFPTNLKSIFELVDNLNTNLLKISFSFIPASQINIVASMKNLIGFMSGALCTIGRKNLVGLLMVKACEEMCQYLQEFSCGSYITDTVYGLSFLGDFECTLFCNYSKNFMAGVNLVKSGFKNIPESNEECITVAKAVKKNLSDINDYPLLNEGSNLVLGHSVNLDRLQTILLD